MNETLRILVADDDELDRQTVYLAFTQAGVNIEMAEVSDAKTAISILRNTTFDCVFLDARLPDQDGISLIKKLRDSEIKVPIVVITEQGDAQIAVELMKSGATDYLDKSRLSSATLTQVLRHAIRLHQVEMQAASAHQKLKESHEQLLRKNQELEKQRQQIQLQNLKLLEVSQLKSQFLATMSHELRTPMNAIIGFAQILLRPKFGKLTYQQADMVERILNNGKHLLMLVNEVLDFSKLEEGKLALQPEFFDLANLTKTVVGEVRSLAEAKKLSLIVKINIDNPVVFNDPIRVKQILLNLLSNAIKFTESGSIWVEVKNLEENRVAIAVRDTGIGISSQDFQHIFEAFRQLDQTITRKYPGTGLGLAIINSLVQMMGGKILLESQIGVGSMFKIELPRQISLSTTNKTSEGVQFDGSGILSTVQKIRNHNSESRT
ncbi:hybrid sensor histidine kinase/response regulator [Nostoc sp. CENA543]|uniref:ATP-binding response regulator n=1 Tax=Nostoc sp. CENA543 TaxID=1869241 RepID=UPI000CA25924|nr:ATP-binding protein [Nostoc sp. CENA543]AUS99697.1 hybrid sensor histidine kinase/response regulator [Nostoc sp. CENA543]